MSIPNQKQEELFYNYAIFSLNVLIEQYYHKSNYIRLITIYRYGPKGGIKTLGKSRVNLDTNNISVRQQFSDIKKKIRSKSKSQ